MEVDGSTTTQLSIGGYVSAKFQLEDTVIMSGVSDNLTFTVGTIATYHFLEGFVYGLNFAPRVENPMLPNASTVSLCKFGEYESVAGICGLCDESCRSGCVDG
jgi:hypothetical protein